MDEEQGVQSPQGHSSRVHDIDEAPVTPSRTGAHHRRRPPPVQDNTVADVLYELVSPSAWRHSVRDNIKYGASSLISLRYTTFSDILSGLVCGILMSGFAGVFAGTIFDGADLDKYVDVGVSSQQVSIVISGFFHILFSQTAPIISAPDVNPAIFLGMMASTAQRVIMKGGDEISPNIPDLEPELVTTILVITIISTSMLGVLMMLMGTFRWTRILELLPSSVLCGFMGSVGFTIFYKSLSLAMPLDVWNSGILDITFWKLLSPAIVFGVAMLLRERFQLGRPAIAVPLLMIVPVGIFSAVIFSSKAAEEQARLEGWLFPRTERALPPSRLYEMSYGSPRLINWRAIEACIPQMVLMFVVAIVDALLRLAGLKKTLQLFDARADREVVLMGKYNLLNGLLVGVPGYAQASLTRVNTGIIRHGAKSRIPGIIAIVINLILLLSGFPLHNFMPRFWLSGLLMFAGLQFLVDNLVDSRQRLSKPEYFAVWMIIIVNYFFGLAWSVLFSLVLSALIFTLAYGKEGAIKAVYSGATYRSSSERSTNDAARLAHLGKKVLIIQLHRFIFFGSASLVNDFVKGFLDEQRALIEQNTEETVATTVEAGRCTFFVFDFEHVEDIDHTALSILNEMIQRLLMLPNEDSMSEWSVPTIIFTSLSQQLHDILEEDNIVSMIYPRGNAKLERVFSSLDLGLEWVEETLLSRASTIRKRWLALESFKKVHSQARAYAQNEVSEHVLGVRLGASVFRYTRQLRVPVGSTLLEVGERDPCAYILQSGRLTLYTHRAITDSTNSGIGDPEYVLSRVRSLKRGAFLNEDVLYSDDDSIAPYSYTVIADTDSVLFSLNKDDMKVLDAENPSIAIELHRKIVQYIARTTHILDKNQNMGINAPSLNNTAQGDVDSRPTTPVGAGGVGNRFRRQDTASSRPQDEASTRLIDHKQGLKGFVKNVGARIANMPLINESLVVTGFRVEASHKKSLLDVSSLNSGEGFGRRIAQLLLVDNMDSAQQRNVTLSELKDSYDSVNEKLEQDWFKFTLGSSILYPDQVTRVFTVSKHDANEMIWEADTTGRGGINLVELITTLITVDEKELEAEQQLTED